MPTRVVMPALGMAQETGKLIAWLKQAGDSVEKGDPLMEIETDKATVEVEAPAKGILGAISAQAGEDVPVGKQIALILTPGEQAETIEPTTESKVQASPVARKIASANGISLNEVKPAGGRITKGDVEVYLENARESRSAIVDSPSTTPQAKILASPKARRLAAEQGMSLSAITGSGPEGAVLAADLLPSNRADASVEQDIQQPGTLWRIMAERMAASWTSAPHFYLAREVLASSLIDMRSHLVPLVEKRNGIKPSFTDILVKLVSVALRGHPSLNNSWISNGIRINHEINIGLAVGLDDGLVVPVLHNPAALSIGEIAQQRKELIERAQQHHLHPDDMAEGTFTITNLGMYGVDAFMAVLNPPQAAILAVGRIAERVVPEHGQAVVRPTLILTLSCDHRVVDGMRAAKFLDELTQLIEEPWGVLA